MFISADRYWLFQCLITKTERWILKDYHLPNLDFKTIAHLRGYFYEIYTYNIILFLFDITLTLVYFVSDVSLAKQPVTVIQFTWNTLVCAETQWWPRTSVLYVVYIQLVINTDCAIFKTVYVSLIKNTCLKIIGSIFAFPFDQFHVPGIMRLWME